MLTTLTMTILGADRPGLVQLLADRVAAHGGNWLESRMCRLGGQFTGIVRAEVDTERAAALEQALRGLEGEGLRIQLHSEKPAPQAGAAAERLLRLELVGNDRPGIVRSITSVLAAHGANVEEFESECVNAPMDGTRLFQARITVLVPERVSTGTLRLELEKIAADLMVDLQLGR